MKFSRQGPFNDSGKTFYPFTLLALLFSERHWLCSQTIPTIPMFFAYSKVKGICHMGEMVQYLQTMSCKQVQKHRGLCCFPIPTKKTQDQRFEITLMKQIQRFNFWGSGFSNSWSTEEAPPSDYPSSSSWLKLKQRTITGVEINQKENNAKSKGVCRLSSWFNLPVPLTNHVPPQNSHGTAIASCTAPEWCVYSRLTNWSSLSSSYWCSGQGGWGKWRVCFSFWRRMAGQPGWRRWCWRAFGRSWAVLSGLWCFRTLIHLLTFTRRLTLVVCFFFFMAVPWRMAFNELGCQNVQMTSVDYCCVSSLRLTIFSHHRGQVSLLVTFFWKHVTCCLHHDPELIQYVIQTLILYYTL